MQNGKPHSLNGRTVGVGISQELHTRKRLSQQEQAWKSVTTSLDGELSNKPHCPRAIAKPDAQAVGFRTAREERISWVSHTSGPYHASAGAADASRISNADTTRKEMWSDAGDYPIVTTGVFSVPLGTMVSEHSLTRVKDVSFHLLNIFAVPFSMYHMQVHQRLHFLFSFPCLVTFFYTTLDNDGFYGI